LTIFITEIPASSMKKRYSLSVIIGASFLLATMPACKKEKVDDSDHGFPITLTVEKPDRNIILRWTETKISNFESYIVVRSSSPIPDQPSPPPGIIATIDDYKTPTFEDTAFPFSEFVYYKVYVKIGDRFLSSPTVKFATNIKLLDIIVSRVIFDTQKNLAYIFDGGKNRLFKYDYEREEITDTLTLPNTFDLRMAIGNHGNGDEIYLANNKGDLKIDIYNAENFEFKTSMNVNGFVYSMASGNNDLLYVATDHWQYGTSVYKRSNKQFKSGNGDLAGGGDIILKVVSDDGLQVVAASFFGVQKLTVNAQGTITGQVFTNFQGNLFGIPQNIATTEDYQFLIPEISGSILNKELVQVGSLSFNTITIFADFAFSATNDKVWGFLNNPFEIQEFSLPKTSMTKRTPLNYQPFQAVRDGDELIIVGFASDGFSFTKTIVDKIKI
jgi:hypothetical protein